MIDAAHIHTHAAPLGPILHETSTDGPQKTENIKICNTRQYNYNNKFLKYKSI